MDCTSDEYSGDKDTLIENGIVNPKKPDVENPESYGEVAPLQLEPPKEPKKGSDGLKMIIISCVVFAIGVTVALIITIYCAAPQIAPHGAVACDDERCSQVGVDVMKSGGNAVDAAVSVMFCLSVVQAESSGIGGGGFMIYRDHKQKQSTTYDFRETAPQTVDTAALDTDDKTNNRGVFVGVPGYLRGLAAVHKSHGSKKWASLVQPSIELARNGFNVSKTAAYKLDKYIHCEQIGSNLMKMYCKEDGTVYKEGEMIKLEKYASVLERVANEGADILYSGELAQEIIDTVNAEGGQMTMDDITNYNVIEGEPVTTTFKNMTVETVDAPSGGPLLLFALNVLERYGIKPSDKDQVLYYHRLIETIKFSNVVYEYLGDPAVKDAIKDHVSKIIDPEYAKSIVAKINDTTTQNDQYYIDASGLFEGQTFRRRRSTHTSTISVIGPKEDHVTITGSLNSNFGSKLMTPSGIILNNQLADFSNVNTSNNYFSPGARPLSHITPTIVHSRNKPCGLRLATGGVGGWTITSELVQTLVNVLAFNMNLKDSIETPLIQYRYDGTFLAVEGFSTDILSDLHTRMGHNITILAQSEDYTVVNTVMKVNETVSAHASSNRGGGDIVF